MKKTFDKSLYTQSEYGKLIGQSRHRVNQLIKEGKLDVVEINGAKLIKVKIDIKGGQNG